MAIQTVPFGSWIYKLLTVYFLLCKHMASQAVIFKFIPFDTLILPVGCGRVPDFIAYQLVMVVWIICG